MLFYSIDMPYLEYHDFWHFEKSDLFESEDFPSINFVIFFAGILFHKEISSKS